MLTAGLGESVWQVKIRSLGSGNYIVNGRGTELRLAIRASHGIAGGEYLIAELNYNRCGCLNAGRWIADDMRNYIGFENMVDAATLAVALNHILI